ncbi:hypothetical protein XENOCAPTIV_023416 [Xenoophorus captivus]|uniref:Uncharacterized protein n=1 Tax=Xenoophorus captivus TaxID=1517983 RepID=A0ABV0QBE1_9TELE
MLIAFLQPDESGEGNKLPAAASSAAWRSEMFGSLGSTEQQSPASSDGFLQHQQQHLGNSLEEPADVEFRAVGWSLQLIRRSYILFRTMRQTAENLLVCFQFNLLGWLLKVCSDHTGYRKLCSNITDRRRVLKEKL